MMFEMVLSVALSVGAVYGECGHFYVHECGAPVISVDDFDADVLGSLCAALGYDVVGCDFDGVLCSLLEMFGSDFYEDECGFSGSIDGEQYDFLVDFED